MRISGLAARELPLFQISRETMSGEGGHRIIKWTLPEKPPFDNPGGWVTGLRDWGGE